MLQGCRSGHRVRVARGLFGGAAATHDVGTQELNVLLDRFRLSVAAPRLGKVFIFNIVIDFNPIFAFVSWLPISGPEYVLSGSQSVGSLQKYLWSLKAALLPSLQHPYLSPHPMRKFCTVVVADAASKFASRVTPASSFGAVCPWSIQVSQLSSLPLWVIDLFGSYLVGSRQMYLFSSELFAWALVPRSTKVRAMTG